jgi:hypothetical protein
VKVIVNGICGGRRPLRQRIANDDRALMRAVRGRPIGRRLTIRQAGPITTSSAPGGFESGEMNVSWSY